MSLRAVVLAPACRRLRFDDRLQARPSRSDSAAVSAGAHGADPGPAPAFTFAPPSGRRVQPVGLNTGGRSSPGLYPLSSADGRSVSLSDTANGGSSGSETSGVGFDAPYASDLRFLALPGLPAASTTTSPADTTTTTTTPAAPVGPPPTIENVHTTALTPFSATIAWRTTAPSVSQIAYGLDAPIIWTAPEASSTEHQATLTGLGFSSTYKLAVTAVNEGGSAAVAEFVLTTPSLSGPVQMTTSNGAILMNGQPYFPKLVWNQCPDAVAGNLADGIDLFMGNGLRHRRAARLLGRGQGLRSRRRAQRRLRHGRHGRHAPAG